jgi:hypothetical protein
MELIIKVLYKEEEEEKRGIIPFCLASTTINKQINKNISK